MNAGGVDLIGLTGGIASGKSLVAHYLRQQGYAVIEADRLGHRALEPERPSYQQVLEAFGRGILQADGTINRAALGAIVFAHPEQLQKLNRISHPVIAQLIQEELAQAAPQSREGIVFLEAAILLQGNWKERCRAIWVVSVSPELALIRLASRNGFTPAEAQARLEAQWSNAQREQYADFIIQNETTLEALYQQVDQALLDLRRSLGR